jgi:hypothetical protein
VTGELLKMMRNIKGKKEGGCIQINPSSERLTESSVNTCLLKPWGQRERKGSHSRSSSKIFRVWKAAGQVVTDKAEPRSLNPTQWECRQSIQFH